MGKETAERFGQAGGRLRGMLHWPAAGVRSRALVMCPPFGEERKSAARTMTLAARALARRGCFVLRFDYYGTGESDGFMAQTSVARWLDDIAQAREHLAARAGVRSVGLLGIRFGATLAALLPPARGPLAFLILWGPLMSGAACIEEARRHLEATRLVVAEHTCDPEREGPVRPGGWDMGGFRLTNRLGRHLERIELPESARLLASRVVLVGFSGRRSVPPVSLRLAEKLTAPGGQTRCLAYATRPFWVTASRYDPADLVDRSLEALDGVPAETGDLDVQVRP